MKFRCIGLIFLLAIGISFAQDIPKDSITYLEEVIIYDPVKKNKSLGITPSSIIREKAFQNHSPIDLSASVNQISGVYLLSGALNTNRITIRGVGARTPFGTDKLRLYFNGIPVTNGTGFSTIEAFDLENLQSVEVIKGPKGSPYGANLGGAILLNTKMINEEGAVLRSSFTAGSYQMFKNNTGFSYQDEKWNLQLDYNYLSTDGYRDNNEFDRNGLLLNTSYKLNSKNSLGLLVNYIDYTAQIPSSLSRTAFEEDPTQAAFTWSQAQGFEANKYTLAGLSYDHQFNPNHRLTNSVFYSYLDHYEPRPFNILDEFTNGYGFRSVLKGNINSLLPKTNYVLGAELYKDEYHWQTYENLYQDNNGEGSLQGAQISDNREFRRQFNAFGSLGFELGNQVALQLGLNVNKTVYDFRDLFNSGSSNTSARRNFKAIWLPKLDLQYTLSSRGQLFANSSRGYSNPNLEETLTPDGLINPDIKQETGWNYEVGTKFSSKDARLWLSMAVFRMDIKNLLVAERVGEDQFIGRNAGQTRHQGLELDLNYLFSLNSDLNITPFLSYTFSNHKFVDFVDGEEDYSGNPLTGVPANRFNLGFKVAHQKGFFWNNTYQYVGTIPLRDDDSISSDAFGVYNTRIGYRIPSSGQLGIELNFGINNVFDTLYAQSVLINAGSFGGNEPRYFYPGNDRNYYGNISIRYSL